MLILCAQHTSGVCETWWNATSGRVGCGCGFAARFRTAPSARIGIAFGEVDPPVTCAA